MAAVTLAAGRSQRMGQVNKLLADCGGKSMIARVVDNILSSRARPVLVVTGSDTTKIESALAARQVVFVHNPDFASGLAGSLRAGILALPESTNAALICLGDMPLVEPMVLNRLIEAYNQNYGQTIFVPTAQGRRGNPVLWDRCHFAAMAGLTGDQGARPLLEHHAGAITEISFDDLSVITDFDTPESFEHESWAGTFAD